MWRRTWLVVVCVLVALLTGTQAIQHLKDGVLPGLVPGVPHPVLPLIHDVMSTLPANSSTQTSSTAANDTSEHTSNFEMMNAAQPTCFYSAQPPQPVTPLESCPSYSTYACCDAETADWVQSEIMRKITSRKYDQCPGCVANLKSLGCGLSCSPDQSQFLRRKENHVNDTDTYYQFLQDPPRVEPLATTIFMVCRSFCESIFHSCGPSVTPESTWNVWELYKEKQQGAKEFCETLLGEAEGVQLAVVDEDAGVPCFAPLEVNPCCNSNETVCPKPTPTPLPMVQPPIPAVAVPEQPVATATPTPQPTPTPTPLPADPRAVHHTEVLIPTPTPAVEHKHLKEIHYKIVHNPQSKGEGLVPTGYQYKVIQKTYVSDKDPSKVHIVKFVSNDEDETLPPPKPLTAVMPSPTPIPVVEVPKKEKITKIHYREEGKKPDPSNITELHYAIENQPDAILSDAELKVLHHSQEVPAARKEIPAHMEQHYGRPAVDHTPYDRQVRQDQKWAGNKFYHALKHKVESSHELSVTSAKTVKEQIERNMEFLRKREIQRKHMEQLEVDHQYKQAILEEQRLERALQEEHSKQEQLSIQQRIEEAKMEAQKAYEEKLQLALEVAEDELALQTNHTESETEQPQPAVPQLPPRPKILKVTPTPTPTPAPPPVSSTTLRSSSAISSSMTSSKHSKYLSMEEMDVLSRQTGSANNLWYSYDWGSIHFTVMSSEHNFFEDSEQYKWVARDLARVDRKVTPWLIFVGHRPMYSSNGAGFSESMQSVYEHLFEEYKVDLALWGHVHGYERTCPVLKNECVSKFDKDNVVVDPKGTVHVTIGMSGKELAGKWDSHPKWSEARILEFGYTRINTAGGKSLHFEFTKNHDRSVADQFSIVKSGST
eukprot:GILK01003706.1.p1 GENE.GILK01003706.1~~GILK01003706.1.p1  ORF type:complete len:883 (-),score=159.18 GILK01003706.1:160-2808(-)